MSQSLRVAIPRFYFSLRSPYSWLAYHDLLEGYPDVAAVVDWRPFWEPDEHSERLLSDAGGRFIYTPMSREKHLYILHDVRRLAATRKREMTWPIDRNPCWEIPHLAYLVARSHSLGVEFIDVAYRARWQQGRDICDRRVIGELAEELGLDPHEAIGAADDPELRRLGTLALLDIYRDDVFGVPFFVHRRDKYWGVDRLPSFVAAVRAGTQSEHFSAPELITSVNSSDAGHAGGCG
jgi:2-hydroxychromene-2-carboxylate isomerase